MCAQAEPPPFAISRAAPRLLIQERNPQLLSPRLNLENRLDLPFLIVAQFIHQLNFRFHRFRIKQCNASPLLSPKEAYLSPEDCPSATAPPGPSPHPAGKSAHFLFLKILHKNLLSRTRRSKRILGSALFVYFLLSIILTFPAEYLILISCSNTILIFSIISH